MVVAGEVNGQWTSLLLVRLDLMDYHHFFYGEKQIQITAGMLAFAVDYRL
ncbi:MAG TPA: hypothetical protein VK097_12145 [Lentibacillus sp.]|nr:hypothetical protein [Lentibacillus sp.]HLR63173.1 hypothetical protein [Lentibacillus sp.]